MESFGNAFDIQPIRINIKKNTKTIFKRFQLPASETRNNHRRFLIFNKRAGTYFLTNSSCDIKILVRISLCRWSSCCRNGKIILMFLKLRAMVVFPARLALKEQSISLHHLLNILQLFSDFSNSS